MPSKRVLPAGGLHSCRVGWEDVTPSEAVENGDWLASRLHPFNAYDVGAVVPTGFAGYARILHPAFKSDVEVRWSQVAAWSGKVIHPEVQFHAIASPLPGRGMRPMPFDSPPRNGVLSVSQVRALAALLVPHTDSPAECWFCLWDGYGSLGPGTSIQAFMHTNPLADRWRRWRTRVTLRKPRPRALPGRRVTPNRARSYLLFAGPLNKVAGWQDGPNLWWPDDRAWCVASEIDLPYTYVGGSKELIAEILTHPALEALPSDVGDGITYDSDNVNSIA
jgi:hypothetical protein